MNYKNIFLLFLCGILIFSCKDLETKEMKKEPYILKAFERGEKTYYVKLPSGQLINLGLDDEGKIETMIIVRDTGLLRLDFYKNGNLEAKTPYTSEAKRHGRVYFFYEGSGNLNAYFNYVNDKKIGLAQEYYDTTANLKSQMIYNESERKIWHKFLSKDGEVIREEGKLNITNQ
jgi:antitoxin component YwqK of YwqJK toxin-antitoxin module